MATEVTENLEGETLTGWTGLTGWRKLRVRDSEVGGGSFLATEITEWEHFTTKGAKFTKGKDVLDRMDRINGLADDVVFKL